MGHRGTEDRHHRITDVLVDGPAIVVDNGVHGLQDGRDDAMHLLDIEFAGKTGVSCEIGEKNRYRPPFAGGHPGGHLGGHWSGHLSGHLEGHRHGIGCLSRHLCGFGRRPLDPPHPAAAAELGARLVAEAAVGAGQWQHGAALGAELLLFGVRGLALGTLHERSPEA
jgi:hypothetical protein